MIVPEILFLALFKFHHLIVQYSKVYREWIENITCRHIPSNLFSLDNTAIGKLKGTVWLF